MKKRIKLFCVMMLLMISPTITMYAQTVDEDWQEAQQFNDEFTSFGTSYSEAMEWMQGKGLLEEWFTDGFLPLYDEFMKDEYFQLTTFASVLGGLLALMYLSYLGWQFMSGAKQWEILPLLKPFALGLVIMNWGAFVDVVKSPFVSMQKAMYEDYSVHQDQLNALRLEHFVLKQKTMDEIYRMGAEYTTTLEEQKDGAWGAVGRFVEEGYRKLISPIQNIKARLESSVSFALTGLVEVVALWLLRIVVYSIFFIQVLIQTILIILGPLAVAFSILPAFSGSFVAWLQKFINVSLYGFIAFIVLKLGVAVQMFAMEAEIDRYKEMIPSTATNVVNEALIISYSSQGVMSFGMVIVSFLMTAVGMLMVPKLADYVVGSGGQHSSFIRGISGMAGMVMGAKGLKAMKGMKGMK